MAYLARRIPRQYSITWSVPGSIRNANTVPGGQFGAGEITITPGGGGNEPSAVAAADAVKVLLLKNPPIANAASVNTTVDDIFFIRDLMLELPTH
jgi:hypothetical protein